MEVRFIFNCIYCTSQQLQIIEAYESLWFSLKNATRVQKQAIIDTGDFDNETLFRDYHVTVKQFFYKEKQLLCVEWSRIHFFYELL
ncbi:hypothetical protein [Aureispira sp. CCB-QB1]|uniref:hypothetical protein n=1 Tax=Aureispira sp. CCB-QB1 TaxID=1313421 RepID=UPI00069811F0|nr:hypothetical protein [Aureispira sp. CCB-QB1]